MDAARVIAHGVGQPTQFGDLHRKRRIVAHRGGNAGTHRAPKRIGGTTKSATRLAHPFGELRGRARVATPGRHPALNDLQMPGLPGSATVFRLRAEGYHGRIVMLSATIENVQEFADWVSRITTKTLHIIRHRR